MTAIYAGRYNLSARPSSGESTASIDREKGGSADQTLISIYPKWVRKEQPHDEALIARKAAAN